MTIKEHIKMYWEFFFVKAEKFPKSILPQKQLELTKLLGENKNDLRTAWLGHSSLLINIDGYTIVTDPIFENRVSLVGPTSFHPQLPLQATDLPEIDMVIISHDHYDHLNKYSIQQLSSKTGIFIVPLRVGNRLLNWGIPKKKIVELDWWEEFQFDANLTIAATPSQHFSGRGLFDRNKTLWASWVIKSQNHNIFFSGDGGFFDGFKTIGEKYGPFDVTFLECGAYNHHWSKVHMFPEQTVEAFFDLKGTVLQPIHWATFNLALHPWYDPIERLTQAALERGALLSTPVIGEVVNYTKTVHENFWWRPAMERHNNRSTRQELLTVYSQ